MNRIMMLLLILLKLAMVPVGQASADPPSAVRTLLAQPLEASISIDGFIDEPDWERAEVAEDFTQLEPNEGATASKPTEVRVLYGASNLYIAARMAEEPGRIRRPMSRRDDVGEADYFMVSIDGFGTGRSAFLFGVTAAGVQIDATEEHGEIDYSWDAVWDSAVRVGDAYWTVEMAIPYSMLRFPRGASSWGIQFQRRSAHSGERSFWQPVSRTEMGMGIIAGRLEGVHRIAPRRNIQVRPYTLSRLSRGPSAAIAGTHHQESAFDVGADVKLSLGSDLILDATINPDFGQVEADPEVLNLTTFETFFPERRPFFLEGTSIFDYIFAPGDGPILYTRRIGALGRIVGAGKLTGSTPGGTSFGFLGAATSDGFEGDRFTGEDFEPDLFYGAGRVKHEFGDRSFVGAALTYFDGFQGDFVGDHFRSAVAGLDWDYRFADGRFRWEGAATGTHQQFGDALALPNATGFGFFSGLDRVRGVHTGGLSLRAYSDAFDPNAVGFFRQNDVVRARGWTQRLLNGGQPFGSFRLGLVGGSVEQGWTYTERRNLGAHAEWYTWWYFRDYQRLSIRGRLVGLGGYDVLESRGLGPVANLRGAGITFDYSTDTRRRLVLTPRTSLGTYSEGGVAWNVQGGAAWTVSDRLALSVHTRYERHDNVRAWVANEVLRRGPDGFEIGSDAEGAGPGSERFDPWLGGASLDHVLSGLVPFHETETYSYYEASVFGGRDQRITDTSVRATYAFRPNLSLQLYTQLFAARFRHDRFSILSSEHEVEPVAAYPRRRDETRRSLNLNSVLRWEYRPGSTVFVVWSHGRLGHEGGYALFDPATPGASPFDRGTYDLALETFELRPTNVVLVKLNYLLMR